MTGDCENCIGKNTELFDHIITITGLPPTPVLGKSIWRVCGDCKERLEAMRGYTGTDPGTPAGIVHRGEFWAPCSCGGRVHAYDDGEVIHHSLPLDTKAEHIADLTPKFTQLLFDYKLVE